MRTLVKTIHVSLLLTFVCSSVYAVNPARTRKVDVVWGQHPNRKNGLYVRQTYNDNKGFSLKLDALYYYGDVDDKGIAFKNGAMMPNVSGSATLLYTHPLGEHFTLRGGLGGGLLRGNNEAVYPDAPRRFTNIFLEPQVMALYYPWANAGFYMGAGVSLIGGYTRWQFSSQKIKGTTLTVLPAIPLEIGYDINFKNGLVLTFDVACHQGLLDTPICNLDGWPKAGEMNNPDDPAFGRGGSNKWLDGYYSVGIILSYRWHNCKTCNLKRW